VQFYKASEISVQRSIDEAITVPGRTVGFCIFKASTGSDRLHRPKVKQLSNVFRYFGVISSCNILVREFSAAQSWCCSSACRGIAVSSHIPQGLSYLPWDVSLFLSFHVVLRVTERGSYAIVWLLGYRHRCSVSWRWVGVCIAHVGLYYNGLCSLYSPGYSKYVWAYR